MGKTRDFVKKVRGTKGTFHAKMGTIKDRYGLDLTEAEDVLLELSCFFDDPMDVGNLISGSSAFSESSLNIWKFMVHVQLKSGLDNFEHYFGYFSFAFSFSSFLSYL